MVNAAKDTVFEVSPAGFVSNIVNVVWRSIRDRKEMIDFGNGAQIKGVWKDFGIGLMANQMVLGQIGCRYLGVWQAK